ncbi:MarR family winged helix-turn-helix transcriptional regulator [Pelosinus sp. IPA-1]|uniref:MarR family winged helix-turn-helix transcriptional regulator n=1 Tax=Pelosinus sp. IPA-1 TaxID=3029569 RepID=UPI0024362635|nr:MarR family winged helix-turn-helix transcriptional regulator [Pelosinus sp. IPA-1]GMA97745.1 MarR family transcriptional regulator [Pelosinus sp. IPA-1]
MRQNNAIALMSRIKEKANRFIVRELEKHGVQGIVPSHGEIIVHLFDSKEYTMKELAEKIHRTKPTVTILIDKLVDYGYVTKEKSLEDSRVTYIKLTNKGLELKPIFIKISDKLNGFVYDGLTEPEAVFFEKMLSNINKRFDA